MKLSYIWHTIYNVFKLEISCSQQSSRSLSITGSVMLELTYKLMRCISHICTVIGRVHDHNRNNTIVHYRSYLSMWSLSLTTRWTLLFKYSDEAEELNDPIWEISTHWELRNTTHKFHKIFYIQHQQEELFSRQACVYTIQQS